MQLNKMKRPIILCSSAMVLGTIWGHLCFIHAVDLWPMLYMSVLLSILFWLSFYVIFNYVERGVYDMDNTTRRTDAL